MTDYYYLDNVDRKILNILQRDSRTPFSRLAKMLDLSESTIHMRVKRLVKEGVIKNFGIEIDLDRIGLTVLAFVLIKAEPKKYEEILKKLVEMNEIYDIYDVTGEYYALLKVRVRSREELAKVLDYIGKLEGVTSTYTMVALRTIKEKKYLDEEDQ